ncbi:MAG: (2Fe-2S)-binding protein [Gemmobacter sp.]
MTAPVPLRFTLNARSQTIEVPTSRVLSDLLTETFGLHGARVACGRGLCGACTVLVDGEPRAACSTFAWEVEGAIVETIEGLGGASPVQAAFAAVSAFQCGYCTPGMILLATALLRADPDPCRATVRDWLSSNLCRCTGYAVIEEAVLAAAAAIRAARA